MKKISWVTVFALLAIFAGVLRIVYLFLIDLLQFPANYLDYIDYAIVVLVILILIFWLQYRQKEKQLYQAKLAELERKRREDFRQAMAEQAKNRIRADTSEIDKETTP
jgi:membrane protease YdiL (CAAX protease family)